MQRFIGPDGQPYAVDGLPVFVQRSARRRRTVSARRESGGVLVLLPAGLGPRVEREWVDKMARKVLASEGRRRPPRSDDDLMRRAESLARQVLDPVVGRPVRPASVRWVSNQNQRWGSCSVESGAIRISDRMRSMPDWVVDHVLVHELTHLVETNHTARFHQLVAGHPGTERAKGYLEGWVAALHQTAGSPPDGSGGDPGQID